MSTEICESIHCFMSQLVINIPKLWPVGKSTHILAYLRYQKPPRLLVYARSKFVMRRVRFKKSGLHYCIKEIF